MQTQSDAKSSAAEATGPSEPPPLRSASSDSAPPALSEADEAPPPLVMVPVTMSASTVALVTAVAASVPDIPRELVQLIAEYSLRPLAGDKTLFQVLGVRRTASQSELLDGFVDSRRAADELKDEIWLSHIDFAARIMDPATRLQYEAYLARGLRSPSPNQNDTPSDSRRGLRAPLKSEPISAWHHPSKFRTRDRARLPQWAGVPLGSVDS
jgi:hypothetical protein